MNRKVAEGRGGRQIQTRKKPLRRRRRVGTAHRQSKNSSSALLRVLRGEIHQRSAGFGVSRSARLARFDNFTGLEADAFLRVAVRKQSENQRLVEPLAEAVDAAR